MYFRFNLSFRDVVELMIERGVDVSYETGLPYRSGPTALLVLAVVTQGVMPLRTER